MEFEDWELLQTNSDTGPSLVISADSGNSFDDIGADGLIQANYFSSHPHDRCEERVDEAMLVGSDKPGWIDPEMEVGPNGRPNKEPGEFWPDSSIDRSEDQKFGELEGCNEFGFLEEEEKDVKFEEKVEELGNYCMCSGGIDGDSAEISDVGEDSQLNVGGDVDLEAESQDIGEEINENEVIGSGVEAGGVVERKDDGELEKRGVVWWKMPMEFLKYCMMRMSPVWTVSAAAAFMGFVILGRRLYKMKRKAKGLQIKVAVDDKKASQVMSRAARLNEAFSVVKLVPVIRPTLPAVGSTSNWPVMSSLR